jgi:hypothetical protein
MPRSASGPGESYNRRSPCLHASSRLHKTRVLRDHWASGRGRQGELDRARGAPLGRHVALKVLPDALMECQEGETLIPPMYASSLFIFDNLDRPAFGDRIRPSFAFAHTSTLVL